MSRRIQLFTKAERIAIAADRELAKQRPQSSLPRLAFMERRAMGEDRAAFANQPARPERKDDRRILSGIMHVQRAGCRWKDCPSEYGPHKTLYNRFVRWSCSFSSRHGVNEECSCAAMASAKRMLMGLVKAGLATAEREVVIAAGNPVQIIRLRITAGG